MAKKNLKEQSSLTPKIGYSRPLRLWQDRSSEQDMRIEVVPLIDVIFCILTFFILAGVGLSRQQAITLDLPQASTGQPQMREMLVVSLDPLGQVYLNKQLYTRSQLKDAMKVYHQANPTGMIVLNAARNASYNEVIEILDIMRKVGGNRVALATVAGDPEHSDNSVEQPSSPPYSGIGQTNSNGNFLPRQTPKSPRVNHNHRRSPSLP